MIGKIYTFGLKKLPRTKENRLNDLIKFCKDNNISTILDVRWDRGDRFSNWVCNGKIMPKILFKNFLNYEWIQSLGVSRQERDKYQFNWNGFVSYFNEYLGYMFDSSTYHNLFSEILEKLKSGNNIVLLCVERHKRCHRFLLKEFLEGKLNE
jgi:uncharacterized protein YeaO (DUF488 family)